ncbi:MAG: adenylate/guanylate cyclase domain-containing protein [Melioribacter sp.]|nr:adenylate/guanylate cyclase domain-containing protein [Melioribacter sp.]
MSSGKRKLIWLYKSGIFILTASLLTIILTQDFLFTFSPLKELELKLIDNRFLERGKIDIKDTSDVVIIEIDQESLTQFPPPYNRMPLSRSLYAKLIKNLKEIGVRAIGIDVIMSNPDTTPKDDSLFIDAIQSYGKVVLAGKIDESRDLLIEKIGFEVTDTLGKKKFYNYENIFFTVDSSLGIVQPPPDFDYVFRRYIPFRVSGITESRVPSFGFAIINKVLGLKNFESAISVDGYFKLGDKNIPKFDRTSVLINFYGPSRTFNYVKMLDIIDDSEFKTKDEIEYQDEINVWEEYLSDPELRKKLENKIVLIGSTMPEDRDLLPISFAEGKRKGDNQIYGVEFHANIIQNILWNDYLYVQSKEMEIFLIILLTIFIFIVTSVIRKVKIRIGILTEIFNLLAVVFIVYVIYLLSIYLFINNKLVIAVVSPSLAIVLGYLSSTAYHFIKERQQNVMITGMFSQYVSKSIVNELLANPDKLKLGGEKKTLTVLFSDIAGFTTFAEKKEPEELVSFINEFLNEMTEIILRNGGTLDKYLGDAVMAFWGAPVEVDDHAYKACLTALQMQDKLAELRDRWSKVGEPLIHIRIGINSGEVIVGNIGGVKRFDYTVLGDDVNLASRLEGANKEYGSNIMISDSTYEMVKDKVLVRELDIIRVKGKVEPTKVYELISLIDDKKAIDAVDKMHEYFQGLELYRHKSFEAAMDYFKRCSEKLGDYPSKVYLNRCQYYLQNPPADDWDGVFEFKTK